MKRILACALFLLFLVPAVALADAAPADDDNNNDNNDVNPDDDDSGAVAYTCSDICGLVETCQSACVTGECTSYCQNELTVGDLVCAANTDCEAFNDCLCKEGTGDNTPADQDDDDDSGGCNVSDRPSNLILMAVMLTIGAFALGFSIRRTRTESSHRE